MKRYKLLADIIAILHLALTLLIVLSFAVAIATPRYRVFALLVSVVLLISWRIWSDCPCVKWENYLRMRYDPKTVYRGSFVKHYSRKYLPFTISGTFIKIAVFAMLIVLAILTIT